ncbi:dihydrolipoyl dehydrogenase family protein [Auraticoccus monumenti]|uniref:Pyruvate/2-oxoglutarate dehydrogenase complex, dihydrolipoamide dehydrogenase (E3) component n=1 Tax=Auraticoccus monumenti TaxID=675864 RepID=A0A1G6YVC9_9ACTN|nr:FAD-dependent oxidoreductase [Auraticoccus monumenti]SDD94298.1 Pyruvate/2-oxoglutarate dehydrogenase complex, dihydrolipoamide dehydrogenase (E3) component [Auraticoccus monumenti]
MPTSSARPDEVELVVVGGGTAGILTATTAAALGARVVMIERAPAPGGDCLWTGCVPSKSLLSAARSVAAVRAGAHGLPGATGDVDLGSVLAAVQAAIDRIAPDDSVETLTAAGVEVRRGTARFTGPRSLEVDGVPVGFDQAVVATGSEPRLPAVPGLAELAPLTSDTVWGLETLPARLLVLGGGSIGCELAQAFARLGSHVVLAEVGPRLLPQEDADAAELVRHALTFDGVDVRFGAAAVGVTAGGVTLADGSTARADRVLVAVGRSPRTAGLGLEAAGVAVDGQGRVLVDDHLRTSNPAVWAAGDVTPHPQYTHLAGVHGSVVAANAVLGLRRRASAVLVPRVTFTDPEVAAVGLSPEQGRTQGRRVVRVEHRAVDRAVAEQRTDGFTTLVLDRRRRVVGALVVGPRAGETIGEAALAVQRRVSVSALVGVTHPYPTFNDGLWNAAVGEYRSWLGGRPVRSVLDALRRIRRARRQAGRRLG